MILSWLKRLTLPLVCALFTAQAWAVDPVYTGTFSSTAVSGYDTVAYFTEGKPVKGSRKFTTKWRGATWRFASQDNLEVFQKDPTRYAPQYGGYCAWLMAQKDTASGDPRHWSIVDGKLYLNYDQDIQDRWLKDVPGFIGKADQAWPELCPECYEG